MEILPQVAFSRFLYTKGGTKKENYTKFLTFSQKSIDFLVCDKSFYIKAAIELDDSTHTPEKDEAKNQIFKESGIRNQESTLFAGMLNHYLMSLIFKI
jgi:hypothetical protein